MIRLPDEEVERRRRALRSQESAEVCGRCGEGVTPDQPLARGIVWSRYVHLTHGTQNVQGAMCFDCAGITIEDGGDTWLARGRWREAQRSSCEDCGRGLARMSYAAPYCSQRCRKEFYNRRRREERLSAREKMCEVCGEEFFAARRDAKTCSPACRQKAYRQRC